MHRDVISKTEPLKNFYKNFETKMEEYIETHKGSLFDCLKIVTHTYENYVTHESSKFDGCANNQVKKKKMI